MSLPVSKKTNELIDPQAQMLVSFLDQMGLPSDNVIADLSQRAIIGNSIGDLISSIPPEKRKDARYLSKFVIGAGMGLFDYSLNAVWNEVVLNLRRKAVMYGIDIFFDAAVGGGKTREFYSKEEHLSSLKDIVLLDTCRKLELINDTSYKKLRHILDMRNDIGVSHPTSYTINAYELLGYLQNCVQDVLHDNPTEAALQVQAFIGNLKSLDKPLDNQNKQNIESKISELPSHLCGNLIRTVFGIFVAVDTDPMVRANIALLAPKLWSSCTDEVKYNLGIVLEGLNVNLFREKYEYGIEFFNVVSGNSFRSQNERTIIIDNIVSDLLEKHAGWDNFHHEAPVAAELYSYVPDQNSILPALAGRIFKAVMICRIGNGVAYNGGVSPGGKTFYDKILATAGDKYAAHVMACLSHFEIRHRLSNTRCAEHAKSALIIVRTAVVNARLAECLDYLITNLPNNPSCIDDSHFRQISDGYINWP